MPRRAAQHRPAHAVSTGAKHNPLQGTEADHAFLCSARWRRFRRWYLSDAANVLCSEPGCNRPATEIDHVISRRQRPDLALDPQNCRPYCRQHHSAKTAAKDGAFGRKASGDVAK
jgi:5-methylcytosine-specific restriction protein A